MKRRLTYLAVFASALLLAGCYTQIGSTRDEPSRDYSYDNQSTYDQADSSVTDNGGAYDNGGGYYANDDDYWRMRSRFYYPHVYDPWDFNVGLSIGGYYSPFWWNPWDPWYPAWGGGWYYPHSAGGYYGYSSPYYRYRPGGMAVYSGGRYSDTRRIGVNRGGTLRGSAYGSDSRGPVSGRGDVPLLPGGASRGGYKAPATPGKPGATSTRSGSGRAGQVDRTGHGRSGNSRDGSRYSNPPPPPPPSSGGESRSGGSRSGGERSYTPPPPPPASSSGSSGSGSGSRGGGESSSSSGSSRGGHRR